MLSTYENQLLFKKKTPIKLTSFVEKANFSGLFGTRMLYAMLPAKVPDNILLVDMDTFGGSVTNMARPTLALG